MTYRYSLFSVLTVLLAFLWARPSMAKDAELRSERRVGKVVEYLIDGPGGAYDVEVHEHVITILQFAEPIDDRIITPKGAIYTELSEQSHKTLLVGPLPTAKPNLQGSIRVASAGREFNLRVSMAKKATDAVYVGVFRERSEIEALDAARANGRERTLRIAKAVLEPQEIYPAVGKMHTSGDRLAIRIERGYWLEDQLFLVFEVENRGSEPYPLAEVLVFDKDGERRQTDVVHVQSFGSTAPGLVAMIPPNQSVRGVASVPNAANGTFTSMRMELVEPRGLRAVWVAVDDWANSPFVRPKTPEEIEQDRLEKERKARELAEWKREEAAKGRVTVSLQGVYGAMWIGNPDIQDDLDATAVKGLGMRISYGLSSRLDVETEVMGAGTGLAEFDGGVMRSASLGRVQFGGVLRLGEDVIPLLRLGMGLQGASFDVSGSTTGKGAGFEFDALWYFGAGVEVRLGESFSAGVGASGVAIGGELQSIEAGIQFGYTWGRAL